MNNLLKLRDALISLKGPLGNIPAFRAALDEVLHDEERRRQIMEELRISDKGSSGEQDGNEDAPSDEQDK